MVKFLKDIPDKIYVYDNGTKRINLFKYCGTDFEERVAPYTPNDFHIFSNDDSSISNLYIEVLDFELSIDEETYFTSMVLCNKFKQKVKLEEIDKIVDYILLLQKKKIELENL